MEGCPVLVATRTEMRLHFLHQNVLHTVVFMEEVNYPHPQCGRCDMLVPWRGLNGRHPATAQCARGEERKRRRLAEAEMSKISGRAFEAYGEQIQNVSKFRYLGRVLTAGDGDWLEVVDNLGKARKSWGRISRIMIREGANPKVLGNFYKTVALSVLLFGAETWVLTPNWSRPWKFFKTGSRGGSPGSSRGGDVRMGAGNTRLWRRH